VGLDEPAPTPTPRVGADDDARPDRQCAERALTERADAGAMAEQRRRVERDAQRRLLRGQGRADGAQVVIAPSMDRIAPVT
jgi:hypothetical protein